MSHTYAQNTLHIVFSIKDRAPFISTEFHPQLWAYVVGVCQELGIHVHAIGGMKDHIHLLVQVPPVLALSKALQTIKASSSKWARAKGRSFAWQDGYAAFSVSASVVPTVVRYIETQAVHHKKLSFADEFLALLKKHSIAYEMEHVLG